MYTDQPTTARQRFGLLAKRGAKRSLLISGVFFIAVLVMIGAAGTTLFAPHGKAKAAGPSITTQQCHDDGNNQTLTGPISEQLDRDQAGTPATIVVTLYYCPAWDSVFGRFVYYYPSNYVLNQDTLPKGYCTIQSTNPAGSYMSGCTESNDVNAGVPDGIPIDTQITPNDGYQWRACWTSTTIGSFGAEACTDFVAVNVTVPN